MSVLKQVAWNDASKMKEALEIHHPDGRDFDVNSLFIVIKNIFLDRPTDQGKQNPLEMDDKSHSLRSVIDQISSQISSQTFRQENPHEKTSSLFKKLEHYFWDAKLVLTMAAFALNRAILSLQLEYPNNHKKHVSMSLVIFRRFPVMPKDIDQLNDRTDRLENLIELMMKVTSYVVEFTPLTSMYISMKESASSEAIDPIPTAVYWIIRSVLAAVTQIAMGFESFDKDAKQDGSTAKEVSDLIKELEDQRDYLKQQRDACLEHKAKVENDQNYLKVLNIFDTTHSDNREILKALIPTKDDNSLPLWDGWKDRVVNTDVLIRKQLILVISSLDITRKEIRSLRQIYYETRGRQGSQYKMVWIPIIDNNINDPPATTKESDSNKETMEEKLKLLRDKMYCYSVFFPRLMQKEVIRLIRDVWHFKNKTIAVLLDSNGNMVRSDAIHMIRIWADDAFPLTRKKEQSLWEAEKWRLELLVDCFHYRVQSWIINEKYIFLYGGDNIEWIRDFTKTARAVAKAAGISLGMLYVGKCRKTENLRPVIDKIEEENLSEVWGDIDDICFFWERLESMLSSLISMIKLDKQDIIMHILPEIYKIFSYDKEGGWVLLSKGNDIWVNGDGGMALRALKELDDQWKDNVSNNNNNNKEFHICFKEYYNKLLKEDNDADGDGLSRHPCCQFRFPTTAGISIPESMKCPVCLATMERQITLRCCHKNDITELPYIN